MKRRVGRVPRASALEYWVMLLIVLVTLAALVYAMFDGRDAPPSGGIVQVVAWGSGPPAS